MILASVLASSDHRSCPLCLSQQLPSGHHDPRWQSAVQGKGSNMGRAVGHGWPSGQLVNIPAPARVVVAASQLCRWSSHKLPSSLHHWLTLYPSFFFSLFSFSSSGYNTYLHHLFWAGCAQLPPFAQPSTRVRLPSPRLSLPPAPELTPVEPSSTPSCFTLFLVLLAGFFIGWRGGERWMMGRRWLSEFLGRRLWDVVSGRGWDVGRGSVAREKGT